MIYAKYTVVLKTLLDNPETKALIDKALSTYPMYAPNNQFTYSIIPTREELNTKLLNYYKYREIGFETVGRFIDELKTTMEEIMPYYYQLMKSQDIMNGIEDPFGNVDIVETFDETREESKVTNINTDTTGNAEQNETVNGSTNASGKTNTNTSGKTNTKDVRADTPQSELSIPAKEIDQVNYASVVSWNENNGESNESTETNTTATNTTATNTTNTTATNTTGESHDETDGTTRHTMTKKGNQGVNTYAHDMNELREIFINIEQMIINDERIQELFMIVY